VNTWKGKDETDVEQEYKEQSDNKLYNLQDEEYCGYQRSDKEVDISNDADPY
jgi:hypothetical protein